MMLDKMNCLEKMVIKFCLVFEVDEDLFSVVGEVVLFVLLDFVIVVVIEFIVFLGIMVCYYVFRDGYLE